jgi:hypothetical protein
MSHTTFEKIICLSAKDNRKGVRIAAKVFYRILRKNGFQKNQIIDISTNILNCLIGGIKEDEKKTEDLPEEKTTAGTVSKFSKKNRNYGSEPYSACL